MHIARASQAEAVNYDPEMFSSREENRVTSSIPSELLLVLPCRLSQYFATEHALLQHITFPALGCSSKAYTFMFILSLIRSCLSSFHFLVSHYSHNAEIFFINTTLTPLLIL